MNERRCMVFMGGMAAASMLLAFLIQEPHFMVGALPFVAYLRAKTLYPMIERTCWPGSCQK